MKTPAESSRLLRIFLCHSSGDKRAVRELYRHLEKSRFKPWLDEVDLLPGQGWEREIRKAVRNNDVVLVCLSRGSITKSGFIQKEIKFALDAADEQPENTIYLIPVRLEDCSVPERLSHWHWVNLYEAEGYKKLVRALQERALQLGIQQIGRTPLLSKSFRPKSGEREPDRTISEEKDAELTIGSIPNRTVVPQSFTQAFIQMVWVRSPAWRNFLLISATFFILLFSIWTALPEKAKTDLVESIRSRLKRTDSSPGPITINENKSVDRRETAAANTNTTSTNLNVNSPVNKNTSFVRTKLKVEKRKEQTRADGEGIDPGIDPNAPVNKNSEKKAQTRAYGEGIDPGMDPKAPVNKNSEKKKGSVFKRIFGLESRNGNKKP